jgi:plastocyanin
MKLLRILALLLLAVGPVVGCGGGGSTVKVGPEQVLVANFAFTPTNLTVHVGDTVTWVFDQPEAPHNVFSTSGPVHFQSTGYQGTGTFAFRFTQPGTYAYTCQVHPNMLGTITVTP